VRLRIIKASFENLKIQLLQLFGCSMVPPGEKLSDFNGKIAENAVCFQNK